MGFLKKILGGTSKSSEKISVASIPISVLVGFFKFFATAPQIRGRTYNVDDKNELMEIMLFYLFGVDYAVFGMLGNSSQRDAVHRELAVQFIQNTQSAFPNLKESEIATLIDERFSFYSTQYALMMGPDGNSAQMAIALWTNIPALREDILRAMEICKHFSEIVTAVPDFLKHGIPRSLLEAATSIVENQC